MDAAQAEAERDSIGEQLSAVIDGMPAGPVTLGPLVDRLGSDGMLLLTILLTLVFLIPVSIPGVSTVFGAAILLIGISRLSGRRLWIPQRIRARQLPGDRLRAALTRGLAFVQKLERFSRPHRLPAFAERRAALFTTHVAFVFAAVLLMAPFGFVPFSNTLPAVALFFYAIGLMQRDGGAVLIGHLATVATVVYFAVLLLGGGLALRELARGIGLG